MQLLLFQHTCTHTTEQGVYERSEHVVVWLLTNQDSLSSYLCGSTTALRNSRSKYTPRSLGPKLNQLTQAEIGLSLICRHN